MKIKALIVILSILFALSFTVTALSANSSAISGDVNGDAVVNSDDAVAILRHLAGYDSSEYNIAAGDYNRDGVANSDDAVAILRYLAGYDDGYGGEGPESTDPQPPIDPDNPEEPEDPDTPEDPEIPEDPDNPEDPENPDNPEDPENPDNPEDPENPDNPEDPDIPEEPEEPEDPVIKAESVTLSAEEITVEVSSVEPIQLIATVTPADTTEEGIWSSSDETIATVDQKSGLVTVNSQLDLSGYPENTASVTVTYTVGDLSASCTVKVIPRTPVVTYEYITYTETIPYEVEEIPVVYVAVMMASRYPIGVPTDGTDGEIEIKKLLTYTDGVITDVITVSQTVTKEPKNGKMYVDFTHLLDLGDGIPTTYVTKYDDFEFTSYAYEEEGGQITATGHPTQVGFVAVDRSVIPLYSKLYIVLDNGFVFGNCYAMDVGGAIKGHIIDIFLPSMFDMNRFGRRTGTVYVLREGKESADDNLTVKATDVSLSPENIIMTASDTETVYFTATVTPSNTTEKGVWSTDDPDVVTVDARTGAITINPDIDLSQHLGGIATAVVRYTVGSVSDSGVVIVFPAGYDVASVSPEAVMMILSVEP